MADSMTWGGTPTAPGRYAVVVDNGRLPFPAARHWDGTHWNDARGIQALDGPYAEAGAALEWAMERCPED